MQSAKGMSWLHNIKYTEDFIYDGILYQILVL